jgi:hypothetical protein
VSEYKDQDQGWRHQQKENIGTTKNIKRVLQAMAKYWNAPPLNAYTQYFNPED